MDLKEISVSVEASTTTTTSVLKPTTVIASTISREYLKVLELREYCKILESDLRECESGVRTLISSKNESAKIKADHKTRNKINITNSESLLQAKNELYKYKCELKSSYIATEKALKSKMLKYKKIISSYESDWQKALKEFNANPVVVELQEVQNENIRLESKIEEQEKLNSYMEKQFLELKESIQQTFFNKIIEFSKIMIKYRQFSGNLQKRNKEIGSLELRKNSLKSFEFSLFGKEHPSTGKNSFGIESNDDGNCYSSFDVSMFDDVMVPSESLESQHQDEDIYSPPQNPEQSSDTSKDQEDDLEAPNKLRYEQKEDQKTKKLLNDMGGNSVVIGAKASMADENQSQYFRMQTTECSVKPKGMEDNSEKLKSMAGAPEVPIENIQGYEDGVHRKRQVEFEESLSDGSSENQFCNQREIYDCQYPKVSSISSDEYPPPADNTNEGPESPVKPQENETPLFKPSEPEKTDLKSFTGFFTMGNDYNSPKPSIFKLF